MILPVVLTLILLITLSRVPSTGDSVHPTIAVKCDTIELQFDLPSLWLSRATVSITTLIDYRLTGTLFTTKGTSCSELPTVMELVNGPVRLYEFYLLPRSVIHFTIYTNNSLPVWIFWDFNLYSQYDSNQFECDSELPGYFCFEASQQLTSFQYHVKKAGYFNIICGDNDDCSSLGVHIHFERYVYNYSEIALLYEPVAILEDSSAKTIQVTSLFDFQSVCVLLHIDALPSDDQNCERVTYGNLKGSSIRRNDILLFPAIMAFIFVAFVSFLIVLHCVHFRRSRKSSVVST